MEIFAKKRDKIFYTPDDNNYNWHSQIMMANTIQARKISHQLKGMEYGLKLV